METSIESLVSIGLQCIKLIHYGETATFIYLQQSQCFLK